MGWGDELIAAGQARRLHMETKKTVAILDKFGVPRWCELWRGVHYIATPDYQGPPAVALHNYGGRRPYYSSYTAEKWHFIPFSCPRAEMVFALDELSYGRRHRGHVVLEPNIKPRASPNKQWPLPRWQKVADELSRDGLKLLQFAPPGGGGARLRGVTVIDVPSFRLAAAILKHSRAFIGPEGGLHHAAAAMGVECPAVVIFGGFISPQQTGYDDHVNLFTGGKPCGMRIACSHCREAMDKITAADVVEKARGILK